MNGKLQIMMEKDGKLNIIKDLVQVLVKNLKNILNKKKKFIFSILTVVMMLLIWFSTKNVLKIEKVG